MLGVKPNPQVRWYFLWVGIYPRQTLFQLPVVVVSREHLRFVGSDLNNILDAAAAKTWVIEAGLDRDDGAFEQFSFHGSDSGGFVDIKPESVTGAMEKADGAFRRELGFVAALFEHAIALSVDQIAHDSRFDLLEGGLLGGGHGGDEITLGVTGRAPEERAGHVAKITGGGDTRENIENDQIVGTQGTAATAVGIAGLITASDNGVGRDGAFFQTGDLNREAEPFTGQRLALEHQFFALDRGIPQNGFGGGEAGGGAAIPLSDHSGFFVALAFAVRKNSPIDHVDIEAEIEEFDQEEGRELAGNIKRLDAEFFGQHGNLIRRAGRRDAGLLGGGGQLFEGHDFIQRGFLETASELEGVEHANPFVTDLNSNERVVNFEAAEIAEIGGSVSVGEEK